MADSDNSRTLSAFAITDLISRPFVSRLDISGTEFLRSCVFADEHRGRAREVPDLTKLVTKTRVASAIGKCVGQ